MNRKIVQNILDFLLGVSWAIVFLGAFFFFFLFIPLGILTAFIAAFFGMILGFILIVIFESMKALFENSEELKKQNLLLEELLEKIDIEKLPNN